MVWAGLRPQYIFEDKFGLNYLYLYLANFTILNYLYPAIRQILLSGIICTGYPVNFTIRASLMIIHMKISVSIYPNKIGWMKLQRQKSGISFWWLRRQWANFKVRNFTIYSRKMQMKIIPFKMVFQQICFICTTESHTTDKYDTLAE